MPNWPHAPIHKLTEAGAYMITGGTLYNVIADFISHIDVLDYDGKELKVLWRKDIETTIIRKRKITRPGPNPIADIDGDGKPEIIIGGSDGNVYLLK